MDLFFPKQSWTLLFKEYDYLGKILEEYDTIVYACTHGGAMRQAKAHLDFLNDPCGVCTPEFRKVYVEVKLTDPVFVGIR